MFRLHWLQVGGATRGMPRRDRTHRKPWPALGLVACMALLQSGCQSGPFSNCGSGCGSGLFSPCGFFGRVSSRVFNRSNGAIAVQPGVVSDGPVEYAAPSARRRPHGHDRRFLRIQQVPGSSSSPSYRRRLCRQRRRRTSTALDPCPRSKVVPPPTGNGCVELAAGQQDELSNSSPGPELPTRAAPGKPAPDDGLDA